MMVGASICVRIIWEWSCGLVPVLVVVARDMLLDVILSTRMAVMVVVGDGVCGPRPLFSSSVER